MQEHARDVAAMLGAIEELDFGRIKAKLMHRHRGALTAEAIEQAEAGYRQFLKLAAKYPHVPVVPSEAVDEFWHMHILDTQRYAADCERIFGCILHHDPYLGIDSPQDKARQLAAAKHSNQLSKREFGDAAQAPAYCIRPMNGDSRAAYCIRPMTEASSAAAYCIRPMTEASSAGAYCIRPMVPASSSPAYYMRATARASSVAAY